MNGILVVNEFLHMNKLDELHSWILEAAKKQGVSMILRTNAELLPDMGKERREKEADFILFWDKDVKLAAYLEQSGYPVFNQARAIEICDDKALTHLALSKAGIPMPRTILAPKTFDNIGYTNYNFLKDVAERLGFPLVLKECFGSFGQQVYLVREEEELLALVKKLGTRPMLFQEYLESSFGRDIRLQVVGGKVIAGMYRFSETGDFRANLSIGGKMKTYQPNERQCELAIRSCEAIGLDFAGVDLLFGKDEEPIVCEVNSNAHFKNIYDCTGVDVAEVMITHIRKRIFEG